MENKEKIMTILLLLLGPIGMIILAFQNWDKIKEIVGNITTWLNEKITALATDALDWGKNIVTSFIDGILSKIDDVRNAASDIANAAKDFIGISSPAKVGPLSSLMEWGPNLVSTFTKGIEDNIYMANRAMQGLTTPGLIQSANMTRGLTNPAGRNVTINTTITIKDIAVRDESDIDKMVNKIETRLADTIRGVNV